jgi:hypothetical protein
MTHDHPEAAQYAAAAPELERAAASGAKHARYAAQWYFCWLIERRDTREPMWWTAGCTWTTNANEALWFARKQDGEASAGECPHDVVVCEHAFDLGGGTP